MAIFIRRILLPAALIAALCACQSARVTPPSCPPGATLMGGAPPAGEEQWCQRVVDGKAVKDGIFIVYGPGASKILQGFYRNGLQDGEWTMWYENGRPAAIDHYRDGRQNGRHSSWYANGQKAIEGNYRDGRREGAWTRWDPNGRASHHQVYKDDKPAD
jgi:hypothetical protein